MSARSQSLRSRPSANRRLGLETLDDRRLMAVDLALSSNTVNENDSRGGYVNPSNGHYYYLLPQSNWQAAEARAVQLGGHLATIDDNVEQAWVYHAMAKGTRNIWIGLTDRAQEGNFRWSSGAPVAYTNWNAFEPNDNGAGEDFAYMSYQARGKWVDGDSTAATSMYGVAERIGPYVSGDYRTLVGKLTTLDSADGKPLQYSLIANPNSSFALAGDLLVVVKPLDHEATPNVDITVRGTDSLGHTYDRTFTITVADVDEAATSLTTNVFLASEGDRFSASLLVRDPDHTSGDEEQDHYSFSLVAGPGAENNSDFQLEYGLFGEPFVTSVYALDYETQPHTRSFRIRATSPAGFPIEQSFSFTVSDANDPPHLDTSPNVVLPTILEDATNPQGTTIERIIGTAMTDQDAGAVEGIAVSTYISPNWQYSTNDGASWTSLAGAPTGLGLLLAADGHTRIRFVPPKNFNGTSSFNYVAWDRSIGAVGGYLDLYQDRRGRYSSLSADNEIATITVRPVNDAPILKPGSIANFPDVPRNSTNSQGALVRELLANAVFDGDLGAKRGIAVTAVSNKTNGAWQYSLDNGTNWLNLETVTSAKARLLAADANTRVRFVPAANFTGTVRMTFAAWDQTSGINGGIGDLSSWSLTGGKTAFSNARAPSTSTLKVGISNVLAPLMSEDAVGSKKRK